MPNKSVKLKNDTGDTLYPQTKASLLLNDDETPWEGEGGSGGALMDNAMAHNIPRGKMIGTSVTPEQYQAIADGTFKDLYIGDYWTINGVNWRIADIDYYLHKGSPETTKHHLVIIPDGQLLTAKMEGTGTTANGYANCAMRGVGGGLEQAKTIIENAFGTQHILEYIDNLCSKANNGIPSSMQYNASCKVELLSEKLLWGNNVISISNSGTNNSLGGLQTIFNSQFSLFRYAPEMINPKRQNYWLRDIVTGSNFVDCYGSGFANDTNASITLGVRPFFLLS